MSAKLWVVWGVSGDYSERVEWVAGIFSFEEQARQWAQMANEAVQEYGAKAQDAYGESDMSKMDSLLRRAGKKLVRITGDKSGNMATDTAYTVFSETVDALVVYLSHGSRKP